MASPTVPITPDAIVLEWSLLCAVVQLLTLMLAENVPNHHGINGFFTPQK